MRDTILKVLCLLSFKKVGVKKVRPRPQKYSTKFSLFNRRFSRTAVKNFGFPSFQPFSTQSVEKNSTAIFPGAISIPRLFHGFNTPYYYYENS